MPTLISIQVGPVRDMEPGPFDDGKGAAWRSAIVKTPVSGAVFVGIAGVAGDAQADDTQHGGIDRAVLAYSADHYSHWQAEIGNPGMGPGGFGENLTIAGLDETTVHIGDVYAIGDIVLQVSQPRQPCWKLARRWNLRDLPARVERNGRSGWYSRVLHPGLAEPGLPVTLVERPNPDWTVARAATTMRQRRHDPTTAAALLGCTGLSRGWRKILQRTVDNPSPSR